MSRFSGYWWSPDAKSIAYTESDTSDVEKLTIVDVMHPEKGGGHLPVPAPRQGQREGAPGHHARHRRQDGVGAVGRAEVPVPGHGEVGQGRAAHPRRAEPRARRRSRCSRWTRRTGKTRVLLTEKDDAWVELAQDFPLWLEDGSGFLWYTERNGGPEVELRKADGELDRSVVKPDAGFRNLAALRRRRTRRSSSPAAPTPPRATCGA